MIPDYVYKHLLDDKGLDHSVATSLNTSRKISKKLKKGNRFFTDSNPGKVERYIYNLQNQSVDKLPGVLVRTEDSPESADETVNEAFRNHGIVRDYISTVLLRNSYDNKGSDLHGSVHVERSLDNAFWNGEQMAYGDGLIFKTFTKSLDVAAHEIGHGIVQHLANLAYYSMPGALNESFADVFGVTCKHWYKKEEIRNADWLIGNDLVTDKFPGRAIRSFKDEKAYDQDPQPKTFKKYYYGLSDNQGVHINSGIPNHAFYLFCINSQERYSYMGPLAIWFGALQTLNKYSNFWNMRDATYKICKAKYAHLLPALKQSWKEVGL